MARIKTNNALIGSSVVDVTIYDQEIDNYLRSRGAVDSPVSWSNKVGLFKPIQFPGCKPVYPIGLQRVNSVGPARIFFPDDGEALLFVFVAGHKIANSYVKEVKEILEES